MKKEGLTTVPEITLADKLMLVSKEALVKLVLELSEEIALLKRNH